MTYEGRETAPKNINENLFLDENQKPKKFFSNLAVTGLYFFDNKVVKYAKKLKPSKRGEVEITDLLNKYKSNGKLKADFIGRGGAWLDTGTIDESQDVINADSQWGDIVSKLEFIKMKEDAFNTSLLNFNLLCFFVSSTLHKFWPTF